MCPGAGGRQLWAAAAVLGVDVGAAGPGWWAQGESLGSGIKLGGMELLPLVSLCFGTD